MATTKKAAQKKVEPYELIEQQSEIIELDPSKVKRGWRARQDYGDISDLAASIREDGQMQPIVVRVSKKSGAPIIIAGARRLRACKQLGIEVKAVVVEPRNEIHALSLQLGENIKRKQFDLLECGEGLQRLKMVYDRKHPETMRGGTGRCRPKVTETFVDLACRMLSVKKSWVYELLGFSDLPDDVKDEINKAETSSQRNAAAKKAIKKVRSQKKENKLKEAAAAKKKRRAETEEPEEDTYPQQLYMGDCFKLLSEFNKGSFDLILTDPPYDLKRSMVVHKERSDINEDVEWDRLNVGWVIEAQHVLEKNGQAIVFCPFEAIMDYRAVFAKVGWRYRGCIVWHKTNPGTVHRPTYLPSCEAIVWATTGQKYHFEAWDNGGAAEVHNFKEGPICGGNERLDHPAQKPLWIIEELLLRHTAEGHSVLDPFAGVCTTLSACKKHNRYGVGIEKSRAYCKLAKLRMEAL